MLQRAAIPATLPEMSRRSTKLSVTWDGKFRADGSRVEFRPGGRSVVGDPEVEPSCHLLEGDCLSAGEWLLKQFAGRVSLIYLDPPFNTGSDFLFEPPAVGDAVLPAQTLCYRDAWGEGEAGYPNFLWQRLALCRELLTPTGSLIVHVPEAESPLVTALMDDLFGPERLVNRIIWHYTGGARSRTRLSNKHDVLHWYSRSSEFCFNPDTIREPYAKSSNYAKMGIRAKSGKRYMPNPDGTVPDDVWRIPIINPMAAERTGYPTQKPIALLERIVRMASPEGSLVADLCCGSGTTGVAATNNGRRWLLADQSEAAIQVVRKRLDDVDFQFWRASD